MQEGQNTTVSGLIRKAGLKDDTLLDSVGAAVEPRLAFRLCTLLVAEVAVKTKAGKDEALFVFLGGE